MNQQAALVDYARNLFSQYGEDGITARIFALIGIDSRVCGEIGAWDGEHLSNTRALILDGWGAVLAESDEERYGQLVERYRDRPDVDCVLTTVGEDTSLPALLSGLARLDFLSIDIDGLDYDLMAALPSPPPRVLCVEVSAGHHPTARGLLPREIAAADIGQPLAEFVALGERLGYRLVAYTGNAFFVHGEGDQPPTLAAAAAYDDYLNRLDRNRREWLYLANLGAVGPRYRFGNPCLSSSALGISRSRALLLLLGLAFKRMAARVAAVGRA